MNLLFVSNHYPPEVNAPATRLAEHARVWAADGHGVDVLTAVPNFPEGRVYEGYRNRWTVEAGDGAVVHRVPVYLAPNRGIVRRGLAYLSFMVSAIWHARRISRRPDVVVATSPQLLAGLAGWRVARRLGVPFVLEIRDLWPDSVVAVEALGDGKIVRMLRRLEGFLYRRADHIVVVTQAFVDALVAKGVPPGKISVVENGVDLSRLPVPTSGARRRIRAELGLEGRFVASYVGTLGMAHRAAVLVDAAELSARSGRPGDDRLLFLLVGTGSEREALEDRLRHDDPGNVMLLGKQPRERALELLGASDASVVHLRASELFTTVLPSKIFEAMALGRPILLGVDGEARRIVEEAGAGAWFRPEDPEALLAAVRRLRDDEELRLRQEAAGPPFVRERFDRRELARRYAGVLESVAGGEGAGGAGSGARRRYVRGKGGGRAGEEGARTGRPSVIRHPLLTVRTAARLRPRQLAARVLRRGQGLVEGPGLRHPPNPPALRPGVSGMAPSLARRFATPAFASVLQRARELRDGTFRAVGECMGVEEIDWTARSRTHLFSYHLHYFDDAPALAALAREGDVSAEARLRALWEGWLGACESGRGDGWDPYPIACRIPNWLQALALLGAATPAPLRARLLSSLWTQADRLGRTLEHDVAGNHLLRNRTALAWAAASLDPAPLDPGRAVDALLRELQRQVLPDGMHEERTPAYHAQALHDLLEVIEVLRSVHEDVPREVEERAREMRLALRCFVRPDGGLHPFGDTTPYGSPTVATVEHLAREVLEASPVEANDAGPWRLEAAGFSGVRTPEFEIVFDCGPFGARHQPGHGHCDGLSFVLSVRGAPVVVDPGIAGYAGDPHRHWARSTAAHNTIQVDGREQTEIWGTFRAARRARPGPAEVVEADDEVRLSGVLAPFHARKVVHERQVIVREAAVEVRDRLRGVRGRRLDTRLHFAPGTDVREVGPGRWVLGCEAGSMTVEASGVDGAVWETGRVFPAWGEVEEAPVLRGWIGAVPGDAAGLGFRLALGT